MDYKAHPSQCFLCSTRTHEKKLMTASLIRRLQRQLDMLNQKCGLSGIQEDTQGLKQILKVLYLGESKKQINQCQHNKFQSYLMNKLKCSKEVLNFICLKLATVVAQKNYHVELTRLQIKNVSEALNEGKLQLFINGAINSLSSIEDREDGDCFKKVTDKLPQNKLQNAINSIFQEPKIQNIPKVEAQINQASFASILPEQSIKIEPSEHNLALHYYFPTFPYFYSRNQ